MAKYFSKVDAPEHAERMQDRFFSRIAHNYLHLFVSVPPWAKDYVFSAYADTLARTTYMALWAAFPTSRSKFDERMKRTLLNQCNTWINGFNPNSADCSNWVPMSAALKLKRVPPGGRAQSAEGSAAGSAPWRRLPRRGGGALFAAACPTLADGFIPTAVGRGSQRQGAAPSRGLRRVPSFVSPPKAATAALVTAEGEEEDAVRTIVSHALPPPTFSQQP